jgi:hypothetical protein
MSRLPITIGGPVTALDEPADKIPPIDTRRLCL